VAQDGGRLRGSAACQLRHRWLKAVDDYEEAPPANSITADSKVLVTEEQWLIRQKEKK
jgi:hypothetical protein